MLGSFEQNFPYAYRVFNEGELSVVVEKFGGINSIKLIDILDFEGKLYPDRNMTAIMDKNNTSVNRPLYGPAIKFLGINEQDIEKYLYPDNIELLPSGLLSKYYSMLIDKNVILFSFKKREKNIQKFMLSLSTLHFNDTRLTSLKNQLVDELTDWGIRRIAIELRGTDFFVDKPFKDKDMIISHKPVTFKDNCLILELNQKAFYGEKSYFTAIYSENIFEYKEFNNMVSLTSDWDSDLYNLVIAIEEDCDLAIAKAKENYKNFSQIKKKKISTLKKVSKIIPEVKISNLPIAQDFMAQTPLYQSAMLFAETSTEACIRAAADKFGFFMMWDHIYPIRDFITHNQLDLAKKALIYTLKYPYNHTCAWVATQLTLQVHEFLSFKFDRELLLLIINFMKKFLKFSENIVDEKSGFIKNALTVGVDAPEEIGIDGLFYASCINAWYYNSLRAIENLAYMANDIDLAKLASQKSEKVAKNYCKYFYDKQDKYIYSAIDLDLKPKRKIYQNTNTIGLDYPYGDYLCKDIIAELANYQKTKLYHPMGRTAVSIDSEVICEMWKNVHMNQHVSHECKLARLNNDTTEAYRVMEGYLDVFEHDKIAVETFNLTGCPGDEVQRTNWQSFSATSAYNAILQALCGISWHLGGFYYILAEDNHDISLNNFHDIDICISGSGRYIDYITFDDKKIFGTLQLPYDLSHSKKHKKRWEIRRTNKSFKNFTILSAIDTKIIKFSCQNNETMFTVKEKTHGIITIFAPTKPIILINKQAINFEYDTNKKVIILDMLIEENSLVQIMEDKNEKMD